MGRFVFLLFVLFSFSAVSVHAHSSSNELVGWNSASTQLVTKSSYGSSQDFSRPSVLPTAAAWNERNGVVLTTMNFSEQKNVCVGVAFCTWNRRPPASGSEPSVQFAEAADRGLLAITAGQRKISVPEPSNLSLTACGLVMLALLYTRRLRLLEARLQSHSTTARPYSVTLVVPSQNKDPEFLKFSETNSYTETLWQ